MREINPIDLEIIRHRLEAINADAAEMLAKVSGSAIASEANDLNVALMTGDGTVISCSKYIVVQSTSLNLAVRDIIDRYGKNPGIHPGDQFITNDPYLACLHQPDVTVVAPIFSGDRLIAWSGSTVHESDVGGPGGGGLNLAARSIFDEAPPMAPVKIVERGTIRTDIERGYLARSRTPDLNARDLLGQIAANRSNTERLLELCERYGTDMLVEVMDQLVDRTEGAFRARLRDLPDGTWRENTYLQHERLVNGAYLPNQVYAIRLAMTKRGDTLEFDFTASDDEAPGAINSGLPSLANATMAAVLVHLCQGLPWVPGAFWRALQLKTRPGSVVSPNWPAGMAMSTGTSCQSIRIVASACIGRLLDASPTYASKVMATSQSGGAGGMALTGFHGDGSTFSTLLLDEVTGGGGAKLEADGTDTSGVPSSPGAAPSNLETNEMYYPILYASRRELPDSGGPGRHRGGVSAIHAYRVHRTEHSIGVMSMAQGLQHPCTLGIIGGEPGFPSGFAVAGANVDVGPAPHWNDLVDQIEIRTPDAQTRFGVRETLVTSSQGGGGLGDPLDREPDAVLADVHEGLVTVPGALRDYGVVVSGNALDETATRDMRAQRRRDRLGGREPTSRTWPAGGRRLSSHFKAVAARQGEDVACAACGQRICALGEPLYPALVLREMPAGERFAPTAHYAGSDRFRIRHFHCPGCAVQVDVHVALATEPLLAAMDPAGA